MPVYISASTHPEKAASGKSAYITFSIIPHSKKFAQTAVQAHQEMAWTSLHPFVLAWKNLIPAPSVRDGRRRRSAWRRGACRRIRPRRAN